MNIDNKIQQTFNGPLTFMGITFMAIAIILVISHNWIFAILGFIIACFLLFTFSGIEIDTDKRQIKPYYMIILKNKMVTAIFKESKFIDNIFIYCRLIFNKRKQ